MSEGYQEPETAKRQPRDMPVVGSVSIPFSAAYNLGEVAGGDEW